MGGNDVLKEVSNVGQAEGGGVLFVVKANEVACPSGKDFGGRVRVAVQPGGGAKLVEQARRLLGRVGEHDRSS